MTSNNQTDLMSKAPVTKAILKMSIPVVCGMMVQVLYNLVDTFFIGMLGDANQLAAANVTTPLFMLMMAIATIVGTGAASYISRCLGQKDNKTANQTLSTGVAICTGLGLAAMILGLIFIKPFITVLGSTEAMYPFAYQYAFVMLLGTIPVMLSYAGGQLVRSEGAVMPSIIGMLIGTVVNVVLDPIFIFGFNMGIRGAAIATVIGNVAALGYYAFYYLSGKSLVKFKLKYITLKNDVWGQTFAIGVPAALSQFLMSGALIICNNLAKPYGESVLAGMGVSAKLMFIGTFIFMGFAAGCQPLVGYNFGARNYPRVKAVIKSGMFITAGIGIVLTIIFALFANAFIGLFTPLPEVIAQGTSVLRIQMFSFLILGPQMLASTSIQAFGKAKESLILSISRQGLFYIPLMFLLNRQFGFLGLIWSHPLADAITLVLALILLAFVLKKFIKMTDPSSSDKPSAIPSKNVLIITISREYGSGGREIGERIAAALNIPYYDKKLIDLTAAKSGMDFEHIAVIEESMSGGAPYSKFTESYYAASVFAFDGTPESDSVFAAQSRVISGLAGNGSCVIVGRCADTVLAGKADCLNVFIHAPIAKRCCRVTEEYGISADEAESTIICNDRVRANYYKHYSGNVWGNASNYHLMLDSSEFGIDGSVAVILEAIDKQAKKINP